jgi:peptidoglycan/xylan/chitin deacetylase (PgdA/CDA1 family)
MRCDSKKLALKKVISDLYLYTNPFVKNSIRKKGFRALNYHSITDSLANGDCYQMTTPRGLFERQLKFLSENGYNVLSCGEAVDALVEKKEIPPKAVCITFDDGFKDNMTCALPVLEKYNFKATIFLTAAYIDKGGEYLSWNDVRDISKTGIFSFGGHSMSHKKLFALSPEELRLELADSKRILEDNLRTSIDLFAYPFGSYGAFDGNAKNFLKTSGYRAAFTTIAGFNTAKTDPFEFRRTRISWHDDEMEFSKELLGAYDWYEAWQKISVNR